MKRSLLAFSLAATALVVPGTTAPAFATPCNQGTFHDVWKGDVFITDRINGENSIWNRPDDGQSVTQSVSYGLTTSRQVAKHWEAGASAGFDWGLVSADVEGKYGEEYTNAASTTVGWENTMTVKDGWTGWWRAIYYRRVVYWRAYTWRWDSTKAACVKRQIAKAYWGDPKRQYVAVKKEGHAFP